MSGRGPAGTAVDPRLLLLIPAAVYAASYAYLAVYHGRLWLWDTVVHESGRYTLLETTLYASHFLGHIPVLVTIALVAAGSWCSMSPPSPPPRRRLALTVGAALVVLLVAAVAVALGHFGLEDTASFLAQRRQRPDLDVEGGSWNLHLPSTMLQLVLIPAVVWFVRWVARRPLVLSRGGFWFLAAAIGLVVAVTVIVNRDPVAAVVTVWTDPRYLAHSVREIATFALTYYPIPFALLLAGEPPVSERLRPRGRHSLVLAVAAIVVVAGLGYQVIVSLGGDIGTLAQRPDFARGGQLDIPYLLASHAFEHVLDSLFFAALTLLLVWRDGAARMAAEAS